MAAQPTDRTPLFNAWHAGWADARQELEAMLAEYERCHPTYDPGSIEPVFEMMEVTLRNLSYRAQWLHARLERAEATPLALDDDAFYAKLAEAQVG